MDWANFVATSCMKNRTMSSGFGQHKPIARGEESFRASSRCFQSEKFVCFRVRGYSQLWQGILGVLFERGDVFRTRAGLMAFYNCNMILRMSGGESKNHV